MQPNPPAPERAHDVDPLIHAFLVIGRATKSSDGLRGTLDRGAHWALMVLGQGGPQRLTQLATACELDGSTISRHVRQLESDGLVSRTPDPDDGRAQVITLTPEGEAMLATTRARRRALITDRLADWPADDVATLTRLLSRLAAQIEASQATDHQRKSL